MGEHEARSLEDNCHRRGHTKFHDPKNRDPRELDPNATGERIAPNQVNEDAAGVRGGSGVSNPSASPYTSNSHRENKHKTKRSQKDHVGRDLCCMSCSRRGQITIGYRRSNEGDARGRKALTIVKGPGLDEGQIPDTYTAKDGVTDDKKAWKKETGGWVSGVLAPCGG